ncbi:MAG: integrase arm-type DNA-binding domain-containing protein [Porticoccaceae bacterium]|nr:integrase arm-type DNA-binding domain-containing protein [Porticoccaceae bacterium]
MPKLTIKKIESLIKRKEFGRHPDGNQLYLNIREPEGTASWVFRFTLHGKRPWHGFGAYDSHHGLQWAREQVLEFKALVKKGIDPRDHKREEQESARHVNNLNNNTFQKVAQCYIKENQASWRSEVTKKQWPNSLRDYVYPVIGSKPVHLITIHDVLSVLRPIWTNKTTTAIRVRSRIENILDYSTTLGMREGNNPAVWRGNLNTVLPAPTKVHKVKSHPAASYTELHDFLEELRARKGVGARALEFTILTGSRTRPLLLAKWEDIDFDNAIWNCPEDNMKSGKFFRIPLSGPAMKIINNQKKYSRGEYIFGHEQ